MTDEVSVGSVDNSVADGSSSEKMIPQSQVDKIVQTAKLSAAEKARRETEEQYKQHFSSQQNANQDNAGNIPANLEDAFRSYSKKMQQEQAHLARQQEEQMQMQKAQEIASQFVSKLNKAKSKYEDYNEVFEDLELVNIPGTVQFANELDNTEDVMYELAKDPRKLAEIESLTRLSAGKAKKELQKISASIKQNQQAASSKKASAPLSHVSQSVSKGTGGTWSVDDFSNFLAERRKRN